MRKPTYIYTSKRQVIPEAIEHWRQILCDFGVALIHYREMHKLTQAQLSEILLLPEKEIENIESGNRQIDFQKVLKISYKLKILIDLKFLIQY